MILELADIKIHPDQNAAFEEAIQRGVREVASKATGFQGFKTLQTRNYSGQPAKQG